MEVRVQNSGIGDTLEVVAPSGRFTFTGAEADDIVAQALSLPPADEGAMYNGIAAGGGEGRV